ncbi:1-acyl-sn-glycerol-3-phosphate acyltransferase, partial [Modestobacter sp. VKM Ac-2676]
MFYLFARFVLRPLFIVAFRPTVTGRANVPPTGPVILASNHLSFIDSFAIPLMAPRKVGYLAKSEYWHGSGIGGWLTRTLFTALGALPVEREASRAAQAALDTAMGVLRAGGAFGVYPEGTRSRDGRLARGKTGVAWLALT